MRRLQTFTVLVLIAVAGSGCCSLRSLSPCHGPRCASACGTGGCGLLPCGDCGLDSCGDCGVDSCTGCGHDPCSCAAPVDGCQTCATPSFSLCPPNLFNAIFGCSGCDDEIYWSEWFNDPPDCCDPCDDYGYWTGYGGAPVPGAYGPPVDGAIIAGPHGPHVDGAPGCACGNH